MQTQVFAKQSAYIYVSRIFLIFLVSILDDNYAVFFANADQPIIGLFARKVFSLFQRFSIFMPKLYSFLLITHTICRFAKSVKPSTLRNFFYLFFKQNAAECKPCALNKVVSTGFVPNIQNWLYQSTLPCVPCVLDKGSIENGYAHHYIRIKGCNAFF